MSYMHIDNLYKAQEILLFRECYAMEKIHGTSAHLSWKQGALNLSPGGVKAEAFGALFDAAALALAFTALGHAEVVVFGEAYGGKCQGMSATYGKALKFIAFEVALTTYVETDTVSSCTKNRESKGRPNKQHAIPIDRISQKACVEAAIKSSIPDCSETRIQDGTNGNANEDEYGPTHQRANSTIRSSLANGGLPHDTESLLPNMTKGSNSKRASALSAKNTELQKIETEIFNNSVSTIATKPEKSEVSCAAPVTSPFMPPTSRMGGSEPQRHTLRKVTTWLSVPNAADVASKLGLEFVHFVKIPADIFCIERERDLPSEQAFRNGMATRDDPATHKLREGVVLRPLIEVRLSNGNRVIAKHKRPEFAERATIPNVDPAKREIMDKADEIALEWVTDMRLTHVLDGLGNPGDMTAMPKIMEAMIEDVSREAKGEVVENKTVRKAIGSRTVRLFKARLEGTLRPT